MKMLKYVIVTTALSLAVGCSSGEKKEGKAAAIANLAPDFSATTLSGGKTKLSDSRGKVVLLDFWATWCPPCKQEIPELQKIFEEYKGKGLVVIGANSEDPEVVRRFKEDMGITYTLVTVDRGLFTSYQVRGIPTTFIIDKKGQIRHRQVGFAPGKGIEDRFREVIEELLEER